MSLQIVFLLGEALVVYVGYANGDFDRLLNPTDYWGSTCGKLNTTGGNFSAKVYGHYPRIAEDVQLALSNAEACAEDAATGTLGDDCIVELYTVCVASCPRAGDIVCNYEKEKEIADLDTIDAATLRDYYANQRDGCWTAPLDTEETFKRCIPQIKAAVRYGPRGHARRQACRD